MQQFEAAKNAEMERLRYCANEYAIVLVWSKFWLFGLFVAP